MKDKHKWYQKTGGIIVLLILFFPVGLYMMWKHATWNKAVKWVVIAVFAIGVLSNMGGSKTASTGSQDNTQAAQAPTSVDTNDQQSQEPTKVPVKKTNTSAPVSNETVSQKNAVRKAKSYLSYSAFSHDGLVAQLEYEKFSHEDAVHGADNSGGNWNEQAAKKAKSHMNMMGYSRDGLIAQLRYEKFTQEQAEYGASAVGL